MAQAVQFAILGLGAGAAYTLLAQGIVLIYRGSGIVNFAHGAIAMFGAFFCFLTLVEEHGWPVGAAIPVAVLLAALLGVVIQNGILRFMRAAAPLVRLVATLGVLIVLQGLAGEKLWDNDFHQIDQFLPTHNYTLHGWFGFNGAMGRVVVQEDRLILLGIAIVLTFALWAFTRFTTDRARDLRERGERAGGVLAGMVAELPRDRHVGDRRRNRGFRRHPARTQRRAEPDRVHDRRHGLGPRRRADRWVQLVPTDPARWHRTRDRRDRGPDVLE